MTRKRTLVVINYKKVVAANCNNLNVICILSVRHSLQTEPRFQQRGVRRLHCCTDQNSLLPRVHCTHIPGGSISSASSVLFEMCSEAVINVTVSIVTFADNVKAGLRQLIFAKFISR